MENPYQGFPSEAHPVVEAFWQALSTFQRGKRKGNTPLRLAGLDETPSWSQVLDRLLGEPAMESQVA
jgi:hypothetical protein